MTTDDRPSPRPFPAVAGEGASAPVPLAGEVGHRPGEGILLKLYYFIFRVLSTLVVRIGGFRRKVTCDNLERSFPELNAAQRRVIERDYVRRQSEVFAEILYGRGIGADELRSRVRIVNPELLANAHPPRPLVIAGAHHCNWEWMVLRLSLELGPRLMALYKPLTNKRADAFFKRMRSRFGARLIPAKSVLQELARFREAGAIGLVADQVPKTSPEKHWLEFLHQDTAFYMGPELMARALRTQVICVRMHRSGRGRYALELTALNEPGEKLPSGTLTERYARHLEAWIRDDPAGWWWGHKRWKLKRSVY
jgi:KDO2-lipid IV(A) lauroyltransferase